MSINLDCRELYSSTFSYTELIGAQNDIAALYNGTRNQTDIIRLSERQVIASLLKKVNLFLSYSEFIICDQQVLRYLNGSYQVIY